MKRYSIEIVSIIGGKICKTFVGSSYGQEIELSPDETYPFKTRAQVSKVLKIIQQEPKADRRFVNLQKVIVTEKQLVFSNSSDEIENELSLLNYRNKS